MVYLLDVFSYLWIVLHFKDVLPEISRKVVILERMIQMIAKIELVLVSVKACCYYGNADLHLCMLKEIISAFF